DATQTRKLSDGDQLRPVLQFHASTIKPAPGTESTTEVVCNGEQLVRWYSPRQRPAVGFPEVVSFRIRLGTNDSETKAGDKFERAVVFDPDASTGVPLDHLAKIPSARLSPGHAVVVRTKGPG